MTAAPRDGSTVIVLAADCSRCFAFMWDNDCWMQFTADWRDTRIMVRYTYDEELDGYGWVPGPDKMYDSPHR